MKNEKLSDFFSSLEDIDVVRFSDYKANPAYTVTEEIKKSGTSLEDEIEKLQIECRNVNDQNERLQKDIADITEQYKVLSASIENMNK